MVGVDTDQGRITADIVVIATGAWTSKLLAEHGIEANIGIERLQVLATAPRPLDIRPVVYGPLAAKQYALFTDLASWNIDDFLAPYETEAGNWMLQLVSQRANGETLIGCPMDYPDAVTHDVTLKGLRDISLAIIDDFPGLRDVAIDRMWAGVLPFTSDQHPIVDFVRPGLFLAAGHIFGNAAGPMTGKLVEPDARRQAAGDRHVRLSLGSGARVGRRRRIDALVSTAPPRARARRHPGGRAHVRGARGRADCRRARARRRVPGRPVAGARRPRRAGHDDPDRARRERARPRRLRARLRGAGARLDGAGQRGRARRPAARWLIARYGTDAQRASYLADLAAGRRMSGIALTEPGDGQRPQGDQADGHPARRRLRRVGHEDDDHPGRARRPAARARRHRPRRVAAAIAA